MKRPGTVFLLVLLAVAASRLLFPPFMVIDRAAPATRHSPLGHHPFWRPPTPAMAEQVLSGEPGRPPAGLQPSLRIGVNKVMLTFELTAVALVGLAVWLTGRRLRRKVGQPARRQ